MKNIQCNKCARLKAYLSENAKKNPSHFNAPVPAFGDEDPILLIVGLAPGRGTNRTGRPFTGDVAGELLYPTLVKYGFATGTFQACADDTIRLHKCRITNAVKCLPPENKPTTAERKNCLCHLKAELTELTSVLWIVCLGGIAHESVLNAYGLKKNDYPFGHNIMYDLPDGKKLISSYHCSKYNTSTKRLTPESFEQVFKRIKL